jgi:hypothetical protein
MQSDFYSEISERYTDYVDYLRQTGEYDLEVEAMNLEAETIDTRVVKMGKGGDSAFGEDSILETVKANVLKKPFSKIELQNLLKESLGAKDAETIKQEITTTYQAFYTNAMQKELAEIKEKYKTLHDNIYTDKKLLKVKETQGEGAYQEMISKMKTELDEAESLATSHTEKTFGNRNSYMNRLFNFFTIGKKLMYPVESYNAGQELIMAVFLGFVIDSKKKNPYAPSALKLRFALANSNKYLAIPASYSDDVTSIIGASMDVSKTSEKELLDEWEAFTQKNILDRKIRHIITGNLLQAFSDFKGKLVSYTTMDGQTKKGILMPEHWQTSENNKQDRVVVPIIKALPLIKSLQSNTAVNSTNGMSIFKQYNSFKIYLPASRQKAGHIYLDEQILEIVEQNNFEKVSDKMVARVEEENIEAFVKVLQQNHSMSVSIPFSMLHVIQNQEMPVSTRKKIELPTPESSSPPLIDNLLELEAEALMLELEMA